MTYNTRSPAVKRLMKEAQELSESTELYYAQPLEDNLFEWHFTIRGPADTEYDGGLYHGRIILPPEYPMKPPNILLMTPSGRFEVNRKICLSISGYHPETWRPSWSIRTALLAIIGFMPTHGVGAIGSLDYPIEERKKLARSSIDFVCRDCGSVKNVLKKVTDASEDITKEARNLAQQISFTGDKAVTNEVTNPEPATNNADKSSATPNNNVVSNIYTPNSLIMPNNSGSNKPLSFEEWRKSLTPKQEGDTKPHDKETRINDGKEAPKEFKKELLKPISQTVPVQTQQQQQARQINASSSTVDMDTLRYRQSFLLKAIVVVTALLGLLLGTRLHSIKYELY